MSWSTDSTSFSRRSVAWGSHFSSLQFTHRSTLEVLKFWSAVYMFAGPQVSRFTLYHSPARAAVCLSYGSVGTEVRSTTFTQWLQGSFACIAFFKTLL